MATNFPTSLDSLENPDPTDGQDTPSHSGQHANANDAIEALEAKVGVDSSAVTTSLEYRLANTTGGHDHDGVDSKSITSGAPTAADYLVGTAHADLSAEIVVGTTPGGELGGTWGSPTVDATHSGSSHAGVVTTHAGEADPHTGYRLESVTIGTADLTDDAVTYAKMQNISATDRLLGRDTAAAGDTEELTVGGGIEFTGSGGIQTSALTGDVTKAAGGTATTHAAVTGAGHIMARASLSADFTTTSTSYVDLTGLTFAVAANSVYYFYCFFTSKSSEGTNGLDIAVNGPTGATVNAVDVNTFNSDVQAFDTSILLNTATTNRGILITGTIRVAGTAGTFAMRCRKNVSGTATVETNSHLWAVKG